MSKKDKQTLEVTALGKLRAITARLAKRGDPCRITDADWETIVAITKEHPFPCTLGPAAYGFVFAVHEIGVIEGQQTNSIIALEHDNLPFPSAHKGFAGQCTSLNLIKPVTHRKRNAEVLAWHGFQPLNADVTYYSY